MSGIIDPPRHVNVPTGNFYAPSTAIKTSFIFNVAECSRRVPKKQWCLLNGSLKGTYTIHVLQFVEMKWPSYKSTHWTHFIELVQLFQLSRKISFFRSLFFVIVISYNRKIIKRKIRDWKEISAHAWQEYIFGYNYFYRKVTNYSKSRCWNKYKRRQNGKYKSETYLSSYSSI